MIDFPASPTTGQVFAPGTGVIYQWNGSAWTTVQQSGAGSGDVSAFAPTAGSSASYVTIVFSTIISGNTGGWLATSGNGRYTPPAGRYKLFAQCWGYSSSSTVFIQLQIRKNGVVIQPSGTIAAQQSPGANNYASVTFDCIVDANGTDWFDVQEQGSVALSASFATFSAFPIPASPVPAPLTPGDFFVTNSSALTVPAAATVALPTQIVSGNTGNWYVAGTGRYTPPVGRYQIFGWASIVNTAGAAGASLSLRKNGTVVVTSTCSIPTANYSETVAVETNLDANGTDYFDLYWSSAANSQTNALCMGFGAVPLAGMQPAGTITGWRQLGRVVPTAGQVTVDLTGIPTDINDLMCSYDVIPATNDVGLLLQLYDSSTGLDTTAGHYAWSTVANGSTIPFNSAPYTSSSTSAGFSSALSLHHWGVVGQYVGNGAALGGIQGVFKITDIRNTARVKNVANEFSFYNSSANQFYSGTGGGWRNVAGAINGLRVVWNSGTFAAGGAITLWGSP